MTRPGELKANGRLQVILGIWALWPTALLWLLSLQQPAPSPSRTGLALLLFPALAYLAITAGPRLKGISASRWIEMLLVSAAVMLTAGVGLLNHPEKSFLLEGRHALRVTPVQHEDPRPVVLRWVRTDVGDVSFSSFEHGNGWRRLERGLSLAARSDDPLLWKGWTGGQATVVLEAPPGTALEVSWDGQITMAEFAAGRDTLVLRQSFDPSLWLCLVLGIIVFGASLYVLVLAAVNSQIAAPGASLPAWVASSFALGILMLVVAYSLVSPPDSFQLPLLVALTLIGIAPVHQLLTWMGGRAEASGLLNRFMHWLPGQSNWIILIGSTALALAIFGRVLWMNWTMFDDHQIMQYVGPGRGLSLGQLWVTLPQTEMGQFGESLRFRPTYWFLRLVEAMIWGARPHLWHAFRVLILIVSFGIFWSMLSPHLGWLAAGLLCAYTLTFPYWNQVFVWLGPSEAYAVLGLALYVWGLAHLLKRPPQGGRSALAASAAFLLGTALCAGSKENLVVLGLPSAWLFIVAYRKRDWTSAVAAAGSVAFCAYVGAGVLLGVTGEGADVYSQSVAPTARALRGLQAIQDARFSFPLAILSALAAGTSTALLDRNLVGEQRSAIQMAAAWLAMLCIVFMSQAVFYNGQWPTGTRYDFPGMLCLPAAVVIMVVYGIRAVPSARRRVVGAAARPALAASLLFLTATRGYGSSIRFVDAMVSYSNQFVGDIERAAVTLRAHPDRALVLESRSVSDYESVFSHVEFLRAYGVENSAFLRLHDYSLEAAVSTQEKKLTSDLIQLSTRGGRGFEPLNQLPRFGNKCFSWVLSGAIESACESLP